MKRTIGGIAFITIEQGETTQYLYKDHLVSIDVITDHTGAIVQEQSFDAWGLRRNAVDWQALSEELLFDVFHVFSDPITTRGYTGHEMADEVGIIPMNGRIYDPRIGRFLQADPFVQEPMNTQSLNRYSYVLNNPLRYTDPSGYFLKKLFKNKVFRVVVSVALAVATYGAASAWAANLAWASSFTAG